MFINISETFKNCKEGIKNREKDIFIFILIIITGFLGFGLGRLSKIFENKTPIGIENALDVSSLSLSETSANSDLAPDSQNTNSVINEQAKNTDIKQSTEKNFVASKNGTKYYFPWCEGVNKIKEENKVWFSTKEEAVKKGYEPARNCKGL